MSRNQNETKLYNEIDLLMSPAPCNCMYIRCTTASHLTTTTPLHIVTTSTTSLFVCSFPIVIEATFRARARKRRRQVPLFDLPTVFNGNESSLQVRRIKGDVIRRAPRKSVTRIIQR